MANVKQAKATAAKPNGGRQAPNPKAVSVKKAGKGNASKPNLRNSLNKNESHLSNVSSKTPNLHESKRPETPKLGKEKAINSSDKPALGPKVSKSKAGKKRRLSSLSNNAKKELPADSSEEELDEAYSDSSLDSEDEGKILGDLNINKEENLPPKNSASNKAPAIKAFSKETQEKLRKITSKKAKKGDEGIIYIGRLPVGFEEDELKIFFEQFGKITKLRLSRNPKTGASRHYGFIEFAYSSVAAIAAETMNNYLVSGRLLKCQVVPKAKIHPAMLCRFKRREQSVVEEERIKRSQPKTEIQLKRKRERQLKNQDKLESKLQALGVAYKFPNFTKSDAPSSEVVADPNSDQPLQAVSKTSEAVPKAKKAKGETKAKRPKRKV